MQKVNERLRAEVAAHEVTLTELRRTRDELEVRVVQRTKSLEDAAEHAQGLVREIAHRSGNLMSIISAMARQSAKTSGSPSELATQLSGRIEGMGRSQDLLLQQSWRDLDLAALIKAQLSPFLGHHQLELDGPAVSVVPQAAHVLGMAFYELSTNALKHGALSQPGGKLQIKWHSQVAAGGEEHLILEWIESGGPAAVAPKRKGWGTQVLTVMTSSALQGEASAEFAEGGMIWRLRVPIDGSGLRMVRDA